MVDWQTQMVAGHGVDLAVHRVGDGPAHWVLLHGFSDDARCFDRVAAELAGDATVWAIDARCHGESEAAPGGPEHHRLDLIAVLETLGLDRPTVLGHSIGARTAALVGGTRPDLIGQLVLVDPPWADESGPRGLWRQYKRIRAVPSRMMKLIRLPLARLSDVADAQHPEWDAADRAAWAAAKTRTRPEAMTALKAHHWRKHADAIACPALLIHGHEARGSRVTTKTAAEITARNPRVETVFIKRAGHNVHRDDFPAFMQALDALR